MRCEYEKKAQLSPQVPRGLVHTRMAVWVLGTE